MKKQKKAEAGGERLRPSAVAASRNGHWTFLTNHTHVLLCLYLNPDSTLREVAAAVGITERMVQKIVAELVEAEYLEVTRVGRRNSYQIQLQRSLRHPLEAHHSIGDLLSNLQQR